MDEKEFNNQEKADDSVSEPIRAASADDVRKREEKEAGGEIVISAGGNRFFRWLDNFWYHHKWKTIIISFFLVVFVVCTLQMCSKESQKNDVLVVCAGPYQFTTEGEKLTELQKFLAFYLPKDFNGDGEKRVGITSYTIYSKEDLKAMDESDANTLSPYSAENNKNFRQTLSTGEFSVAFLSPDIFDSLASQSEMLADLTTVFGVKPENGIYYTLPEGGKACYGIKLGESALYQNNTAMKALPKDTVLCLIGSPFLGNENDYKDAVEYFKALLEAN